MIYIKVNSSNFVTYREIEGNTVDFYKINISEPQNEGNGFDGYVPEGYVRYVQHFEIGIRTEVEKVEFKFDHCFYVLTNEDKNTWYDTRPHKIGYIKFELYSSTKIVKVSEEDIEDYFENVLFEKEKLFKKMEEINKRNENINQDFK